MNPMTYHQTFTKLSCPNLKHVFGFLCVHGTALAKAAYKLGGPAASARVFLLCEAVRHARQLTRAQSNQLINFHRLLTLEQVNGTDRTERDLFVRIKLPYELVEECCFLSEKLRALLKYIAANDPTNDIRCEASRKSRDP
jgi:hypothetical protein